MGDADGPYVHLPASTSGDVECPERDHGLFPNVQAFGENLLLIDKVLFFAFCAFYGLVVVFFMWGHAHVWSGTLIVLLVVAPIDCALLKRGGMEISMQTRLVRRFLYGVPFALLCFYSHAITHKFQHCVYYIVVRDDTLRLVASTGVAAGGAVAVLSMALAALQMDCNGSGQVARRVRTSLRYATWHLLFRASELSYRLGGLVLMGESLRVRNWVKVLRGGLGASPVFTAEVILPLLFVGGILVLVLVYACLLRYANKEGGKPRDGPVHCFVMGAVTLAMNPLHFFAWPGFEEATKAANRVLLNVRALELILAVFYIWDTAAVPVPRSVCDDTVHGTQMIGGSMLILRSVEISVLLYYLIMVFHPAIGDPMFQAMGNAQDLGAATFSRPTSGALYARKPSANAGLCHAWIDLGGGIPIMLLPLEILPEELDTYKILRKLGEGAFGAVVEVKGPEGNRAMKVMPLGRADLQKVANQEADVNSKIWENRRELAPGHHRMGHPNIVRLLFWSQNPEGWRFFFEDGTPTVSKSGVFSFHMALMMELCDETLEKYMTDHFQDSDWFPSALHFLAQTQLALQFLHDDVKVVYRDLKLNNVLVVKTPDGVHCKLGDFGHGKAVDPGWGVQDTFPAGTPYWCAPEIESSMRMRRLRLDGKGQRKLDVYSFGVMAHALAYGPEFRRAHPLCQSLHQQQQDIVEGRRCQTCRSCMTLLTLSNDLGVRWPGSWPAGSGVHPLVYLVIQCTAKNPHRRPSMAELRGDLLFTGVDFDALARLDI